MIIDWLMHIGGLLITWILDQIVGWIFGAIMLALVWLYKPSLSFKWAKATFFIRHRGLEFQIEAFMDFYIDDKEPSIELASLKTDLRNTGVFLDTQFVTAEIESRIDVKISLDDSIMQWSIHQVLDDDNIVTRLRGIHQDRITYGKIGKFVDFTVAARGRLFNALDQIGLRPEKVPDIVVRMSWDSSEIKILSWLKKKYKFFGHIEIEGSDIRISQSDRGATVSTPSPTPMFKEILQNLVVENVTK